MAKKITTTATVAYILDPDLAIPDVIDRTLATTYGLKNNGVPVPFKNKKASIKARGVYKKEKTDALNLIIDEIAPFIDLLVTPGLMSEDIIKNNMVFVKTEITLSEYSSLNIFGKQLYVKATDALYDRFPIGSEYAKLIVPPPGRFGKLTAIEPKDTTIVVRNGFTSRIPKGYRRMLARLSDGSLLEFYTVGSELSDNKVEALFNKIIVQEPVILKKFILSKALTNEMSRPAYSIDNTIAVIEGNESLPRTPNVVEEVTGYYEQQVPVELSESTVLDLPVAFPTTLFYPGGTVAIDNEWMRQYNKLITKYSALTRNGKANEIVFTALAQLNIKPPTSKYFDTTEYGGTAKDLIHPGVLESILDEYIVGRDRNNYIRAAIELLAGQASTATASLSGYRRNISGYNLGRNMPPQSSLGSLLTRALSTTTKEVITPQPAPVTKSPFAPSPIVIKPETTTTMSPIVAAMAPHSVSMEATVKEASTVLTKDQMIARGKDLLVKYLPDVFGEGAVAATKTTAQLMATSTNEVRY